MVFGRRSKKEMAQRQIEEGREKRHQIISDAQAMKRLMKNADFLRYCELLEADKAGLIRALLNEHGGILKENEVRTRLIARINQIDKSIHKPKNLIWQMEQLTEVREVIKAQSQERQALRNKTGG